MICAVLGNGRLEVMTADALERSRRDRLTRDELDRECVRAAAEAHVDAGGLDPLDRPAVRRRRRTRVTECPT